MQFFDRFRAAAARYRAGVHTLGDPAPAAALDAAEARLARRLPAAYRDFLGQWNGALLFHEDVAVHGVAGAAVPDLDRLTVEPAGLALGADGGAPLYLDERGRVLVLDPDTERLTVAGTDLARWLDAVMARGAQLYGRDGEFRDDAFDGSGGGEIAARTARRRVEAAIRADPDAPAWHAELAALCLDGGDAARAARELERTVALDPGAADAWFTLGKLRRDADEVIAAFRAAAAAERTPEESAFALAHAARAARGIAGAHHAALADTLAADALTRHPPLVDEQRAAAAHLVDTGDLAGAVERLELARAVAPADAQLGQLLALARSRLALRPA